MRKPPLFALLGLFSFWAGGVMGVKRIWEIGVLSFLSWSR